MPADRPKPSFMRAMSQIRNLGAWTWHWLRAGELGALDRNKAFDVAYVQRRLRRIKPKLKAGALSRELAQTEALHEATQTLLTRLESMDLPSPLAIQRVITVIESVQVSLLHTLQRKLDAHGDSEALNFEPSTAAIDAAIAAIDDSHTMLSNEPDAIAWASLERVIASLEHGVAAAHQQLAQAEIEDTQPVAADHIAS